MSSDPHGKIKQDLRNNLISEIQKENPGFLQDKLFLEFGVQFGESIIDFYNVYTSNNIDADFYGFDAFKGLPEELFDEYSPWKIGHFGAEGQIHKDLLSIPSIKIIKGWFSDTLNKSLLDSFGNKKIGIVHMDQDIYSSTVEVLEYIIQNDLLCDGSLILYDDWGAYLMKEKANKLGLEEATEFSMGQSRAHKEIAEKYDLDFELIRKEVIDPNFYVIALYRYNKK
jgi:hypothetical protein